MNLNPIFLLRLLVTILLLVFLSCHLCLLLNLLRNHSKCIVVTRNLQQRLLPRQVICLLILPLSQLLCSKVCILVPLILSLSCLFWSFFFISPCFYHVLEFYCCFCVCPRGYVHLWLELIKKKKKVHLWLEVYYGGRNVYPIRKCYLFFSLSSFGENYCWLSLGV